MNRFFFCSRVFFASILASNSMNAQVPDQREKVAEGEYWRWEHGHPIKNTVQSWTIWRTKDGFQIESKLPPDDGALLVAAISHGVFSSMSPELREDLKNAAMATEINFQLSHDMEIAGMQVNGKSLSDGKPVLVANCVLKSTEISCKGRMGSAKLKNAAQDYLCYSYSSPLLYMALLKKTNPSEGQTVPVKLAMLDEVRNEPRLTEFAGQLRNEGPDKLTVGEHEFDTEKLVLTLETRTAPREITFWTSKQGIVYAMKDSQTAPGLQILLSQFKRFAEF